MKKSSFATAAAVAVMSIQSVAVADTMSWKGFYVGVHGSYLSAETSYPTPATPIQSFEGALLGVQAGYNFHLNDRWVLGVEGDVSFGQLNDFIRDGNFLTEDGEITTAGTLRLRLGYAFDNVLPYITGGLAWDSLEQGSTCPTGATAAVCLFTGPFDVRSTESFTGWVVGAGVEVAIAPRWSLKGEVMFGDYGESTYTGTIPFLGVVSVPVEQDLNSQVQIGVNYRL